MAKDEQKKKKKSTQEEPVKKKKKVVEEEPIKHKQKKRVVEEEPVKKKKKAKVEEEPPAKKKKKVEEIVKDKKAVKAASKKVINEAPEKKTRKPKETAEAELVRNSMFNYDQMQDGIEKKYDTASSQLVTDIRDRLHTGLLVQDIVLSGGVLGGGWYTYFGMEQSAKSTNVTQIITSALNTDVPILQWYDYEGSSDAKYINAIMKRMGIKGTADNVFGLKDTQTGEWLVKPRVRYYQPDNAEIFFDSVAKLLRTLPQIKMVGDKQYYVFPDEKNFRVMVGNKFDERLKKQTGMLYMPTEKHIAHQALILVDSYPAMLPEKLDDDDQGAGMAAQARMFSENIKKIKSKMKSRKVTIIGINQLRLKPMVMFGSPEYEPCGEALKLFSDVRIRNTGRAIPWSGMKGSLEEEKSIDGKGVDTYRYIHMRAIKNKLGAPNLEGWARIWVSDRKGQGCGFDPVYDTYEYARMTGQVKGARNKLTFKIPKIGELPKMTWLEFKAMVIGKKEQKEEVLKRLKYKGPMFDIRAIYKKQMLTGEGMTMFFDTKAEGIKEEAAEE